LMEAVWKPSVARVHEEVADMQALADKEGAKLKIEPWDYRYYMEKVRKAKYDLDQNEIKPYLQLEKLREGIFWVAGELFNFNFTPVTNVPDPSTMWCSSAKPSWATAPAAFVRLIRLIRCLSSSDTGEVSMSGDAWPAVSAPVSSAFDL